MKKKRIKQKEDKKTDRKHGNRTRKAILGILSILVLLCLNSCGRELEEREFPDTLVIRDSAVPFEKSLQTEQDKSSKYLDYGQVRCVLLEDDLAEDDEKLGEVLLALEKRPAFSRNIYFFTADGKALEQQEKQKEESQDLTGFYQKSTDHKREAATLGSLLYRLHNGSGEHKILKLKAKCSFFVDLFGFLLKNQSVEENDSAISKVRTQLVEVERALIESEITATTTNIAVIGALAYYRLTNESKYRGFLSWIKKNNIGNVEKLHIDDVINLYDEIYKYVPKKVFLARWYPAETDAEYKQSVYRIDAIKEVIDELGLQLTDLGTRDTGTFDIREVMYHDIRECDIFIADLTGARHNVMIEVGYALKHIDTGRMVFYFQETDSCKNVPFDVNHFSYDKIEDSVEIKAKTKARIMKILEQAKNGEI